MPYLLLLKKQQNLKCRLLQIKGGALRVKKKLLILISILTVLFVLMSLTLDLLFSKITTPLCKLLRVSLTTFVSVVRALCLRKKIKKTELYRRWVSTMSNQCETCW